ncbi:radical SAM protein, family [gut metagenome]|uniref:Radical SAM protein, family n=1 Tax=gut metagenome TaxID=749906 RepID=J9D7U2_9ZZZZ
MCAGDVTTQLEAGNQFFARKHRSLAQRVNYLAYFQAGSNTYAPVRVADSYFREAMAVDGVEGLVIATRPDCLGEEWLDYLSSTLPGHFRDGRVGCRITQ